MAAMKMAVAVAVAVAMVVGVGVVRGDMSADRTECADQLVGLAPCLQYVQGEAKAPAPDCCGGLRQVLGKSPKCLCVLVKDKDDPNLGIKINATLALALPSACGATHANVSHCPQLLHIPPNSKDAAIFSPGGDKGSPAGPANDNSTAATNSRAQQATNGGSLSSAATTGAALTALLVGYFLLLLPDFSAPSF
ncbi:non-specific lipid transfer protein GPI-anchored 14-like isoform X2 [Oryza brachyantha]|uniref:non-specific lipid transfer protein GPI-anchored 14-like isoform X2 n=1 Tax=Oryza brachyantha TaxID=4533 RepID=UPI001ADD297F|nr:non-specific lipid transfer protein GPI-anchored 14-like isoform X2 [Oryza brachyantha]